MNNINAIYNFLLFIISKERGSFITVDEAMQCLDSAQMELFEYYFKEYGETQKVHDALSVFKTRVQFNAVGGVVDYPSDYLHLLAGVYTVTGSTVNPVVFVNEDELPDALTSQLRPVTTANPIALDYASGFQIYPQTTQVGFYTYLRRPATPVLAYTQVGRTITYDANASIQLEFSASYINNIMARALKPFGINLSETDVQQYALTQQEITK